MGFYQDFSQYYDLIFQARKPQLDFIRKRTPMNGKILDVAAGTGNHALALQKSGYEVWAVEYDEKMLQRLEEKQSDCQEQVQARLGDMRAIESYYPADFFDTVYCIGNSLVHLPSVEDMEVFLKSAEKLLKKGGTLIIQIINYNRILDQDLKGLPTIRNEEDPDLKAEFVREYKKTETGNYLNFKTRLTIEKPGEKKVFENETPLLPLRFEALSSLLVKAGFEDLEAYGNFMEKPYSPETPPLIMTGRKR